MLSYVFERQAFTGKFVCKGTAFGEITYTEPLIIYRNAQWSLFQPVFDIN
jgi:hypothetical protein